VTRPVTFRKRVIRMQEVGSVMIGPTDTSSQFLGMLIRILCSRKRKGRAPWGGGRGKGGPVFPIGQGPDMNQERGAPGEGGLGGTSAPGSPTRPRRKRKENLFGAGARTPPRQCLIREESKRWRPKKKRGRKDSHPPTSTI